MEDDDSAIAVDGKVLKGANDCEGGNDRAGKHTLLGSAVLPQPGVTRNQMKVDPKSNEINAVESLLGGIEREGRVVTFDALHTQRKTARYLVKEKQAHYRFTVTENQPTRKADQPVVGEWLDQIAPVYAHTGIPITLVLDNARYQQCQSVTTLAPEY